MKKYKFDVNSTSAKYLFLILAGLIGAAVFSAELLCLSKFMAVGYAIGINIGLCVLILFLCSFKKDNDKEQQDEQPD